MIPRRIAEHVKAHNWFAVAIDFLIVVVGVFVGLQVNNWNEARANRGIVARHLNEIAEDLRSHLDLSGALYGSAVARIAAVDYICDEAFGRKLPEVIVLSTESWTVPEHAPIAEDRLDNLMGAINLVRITVGSRSGYESLISSGHLGLIPNKDLAREIQLYYGEYDDLADTNAVFRGFRNSGVPAMYAHGLSSFDERPAEEIVALAKENPDFAAYLRTVREWAALHAGLLGELHGKTEALLADIEAELERLQ